MEYRYIKRPRVGYEALLLSKETGGMALPNLKHYYYYYAAQLMNKYCWCRTDYITKWKNIARHLLQIPVQTVIGHYTIYKKHLRNNIRLLYILVFCTNYQKHTLYGIRVNILTFYGSSMKDFTHARYDSRYKNWTCKGVTAWCTIEVEGEMESFQDSSKIWFRAFL